MGIRTIRFLLIHDFHLNHHNALYVWFVSYLFRHWTDFAAAAQCPGQLFWHAVPIILVFRWKLFWKSTFQKDAVFVFPGMYGCVCMSVSMHVWACACICECVCVCVYEHVCMHVSRFVCAHVCSLNYTEEKKIGEKNMLRNTTEKDQSEMDPFTRWNVCS